MLSRDDIEFIGGVIDELFEKTNEKSASMEGNA